MPDVTFETIRRQALDTDAAYCVCHPDNPLKVLHLPKSETDIKPAKKLGRCTVTVPEWLAEEHDIR